MKYCILVIIILNQWKLVAQDSTKTSVEKILPSILIQEMKNNAFKNAEISWNMYMLKNIQSSFSSTLHQLSLANVRNYGPSQISTVSIRGLGAQHVATLWNGINVTNTMHGTADVSLFIPYSILQNNIIRYGVSEEYGCNNQVAGTILQNNFSRDESGLDLVLSLHTGSFNKHQQYIGLKNTNAKQLLGFDFFHESADNNFKYQSTPGSKVWDKTNKHSKNELYQSNLMYEQQISLHYTFRAAASYTYAYREIAPATHESVNDAVQQDQQFKSYASLMYLKNKLTIKAQTAYVLESLNYTNTSAGVYSKSKLHKQITQLVFQRDIARAHQLHLKLENNFSLADNASYVKEMPTQNNLSVLLKYTYDVKKINITVSANQQLIQRQVAPFLFETQVTYRPHKNIYIIAKGARVYRYPTLNDLYWNQGGQSDLQAEKGWSTEYSIFYGVTKNHFYFNTKATNFYYWINNWIQWTPTSYGYWTPKNTKKVFSRGIEIQSQVKYENNKLAINLQTGYSYILPTQVNDDDLFGKQLIYETRHKFFVNYSMSVYHVVLSYSFQYTGSRYTSSDNAYSLPAFHTSDIKVSYACPIKQMVLEPYFSVQNLSNTSYQMMQGRPMMGRNYMVGIVFSLHQNQKVNNEK